MKQDQKQVSLRGQVMTFLVLAIVTSAEESYLGKTGWDYVLMVACVLLLMAIILTPRTEDTGQLDE